VRSGDEIVLLRAMGANLPPPSRASAARGDRRGGEARRIDRIDAPITLIQCIARADR